MTATSRTSPNTAGDAPGPRPIIGIGAYPRVVETQFGRRQLHTASGFNVRAITHAGGVSFVLPVIGPEGAADVLRPLDGVLLAGGGDIQPERYGAVAVDETRAVDPERDAFELALFAGALDARLPILGICRGMQLMNVALGGTLCQDVAAATGHQHEDGDRWSEASHRITIEPGTRLAGALGVSELSVNSVHRQGVDRLASGLRPVAWADDGSVEGVEADTGQFVVGVQWHPEVFEDEPTHKGVFAAFVEEARRYATRRRVSESRPAGGK